MNKRSFIKEIDFLTEKEIGELMEKSEKDGVDYLY